MIIVLNLVIIFLVALIAYWWANQGAFSALIHMLCVIVAGAIALAFWEPLTLGVLLRGGTFDGYVWGISLVGIFVLTLAALRVISNKLVPNNLDLPNWANLSVGAAFGAVSGILSIGILLIGCGWIQSDRQILDYIGYGRSPRDGQVKYIGPNPGIWLPVHKLTDEFYGHLSVNALSTTRPLRQYTPDLYKLSASLMRDSARDGRGQITMPPDSFRAVAVYKCPTQVVVQVQFDRLARDYGDQLTLTASQIRLISTPPVGQRTGRPYVAYPDRWTQETADGSGSFMFDDVSHAITSVPGRESAAATISFPFPSTTYDPRFLQIKGTRLALPQAQQLADCSHLLGGPVAAAQPSASIPVGGANLTSAIEITNGLARMALSSNALPGGLNHVDRFLTDGDAVVTGARSYVSRELRIEGIYEPKGTKIVQVDVSRGSSPADIFGEVRQQVPPSARPMLVDSTGNTYSAMGYIHERPDGTRIKLEPGAGVGGIGDLPQLPSSGTQTLKLVFRVTDGVTLVGFKLGDQTIGTCNVAVGEQARGSAPRDNTQPNMGMSGG